eukprot:TRINITY_DN6301_c0_g1_i2.p1 TRINITY_DN6301_c0_g1~~TRINITY_DN6301_c0_g1_i2.p1  ORF type:complete len:553 (+),score=48.51 TRINITY_DN6301_c0_g1_i2:254-1912(+)
MNSYYSEPSYSDHTPLFDRYRKNLSNKADNQTKAKPYESSKKVWITKNKIRNNRKQRSAGRACNKRQRSFSSEHREGFAPQAAPRGIALYPNIFVPSIGSWIDPFGRPVSSSNSVYSPASAAHFIARSSADRQGTSHSYPNMRTHSEPRPTHYSQRNRFARALPTKYQPHPPRRRHTPPKNSAVQILQPPVKLQRKLQTPAKSEVPVTIKPTASFSPMPTTTEKETVDVSQPVGEIIDAEHQDIDTISVDDPPPSDKSKAEEESTDSSELNTQSFGSQDDVTADSECLTEELDSTTHDGSSADEDFEFNEDSTEKVLVVEQNGTGDCNGEVQIALIEKPYYQKRLSAAAKRKLRKKKKKEKRRQRKRRAQKRKNESNPRRRNSQKKKTVVAIVQEQQPPEEKKEFLPEAVPTQSELVNSDGLAHSILQVNAAVVNALDSYLLLPLVFLYICSYLPFETGLECVVGPSILYGLWYIFLVWMLASSVLFGRFSVRTLFPLLFLLVVRPETIAAWSSAVRLVLSCALVSIGMDMPALGVTFLLHSCLLGVCLCQY